MPGSIPGQSMGDFDRWSGNNTNVSPSNFIFPVQYQSTKIPYIPSSITNTI
jgi:hypothetical protein